jgi:hypothetical protein
VDDLGQSGSFLSSRAQLLYNCFQPLDYFKGYINHKPSCNEPILRSATVDFIGVFGQVRGAILHCNEPFGQTSVHYRRLESISSFN